jgi:adenylate kinase family enzyme
MYIDDKLIKHYLKNVYFINGTAYAGKSTICKMLADKYNMIHCEENYKFGDFLKLTTKETHPNMNYFNTMKNWEEFVTRDKEDYANWLDNTSKEQIEFEILELLSIAKDRLVIVDTNLPHEVLERISDRSRVCYMVTTPEISTNEWFNRMDKEKQFLLDVIKKTDKPEKNLKKFKETLAYANRQEVVERFTKSGFFYLVRETLEDDILEKFKQVEEHFGLSNKQKKNEN